MIYSDRIDGRIGGDGYIWRLELVVPERDVLSVDVARCSRDIYGNVKIVGSM